MEGMLDKIIMEEFKNLLERNSFIRKAILEEMEEEKVSDDILEGVTFLFKIADDVTSIINNIVDKNLATKSRQISEALKALSSVVIGITNLDLAKEIEELCHFNKKVNHILEQITASSIPINSIQDLLKSGLLESRNSQINDETSSINGRGEEILKEIEKEM